MMRVEDVQKDILSRLGNIETTLFYVSRRYPQTPMHSMSPQETGAGVTFQWPVQPSPAIQPSLAIQPSPVPEQFDHAPEHLSEPPPSSNSGQPYRLKDPKQAIVEPLPSLEINKATLQSVEEMLETQADLTKRESAAGILAQILAKEAIFGREVMRRCTPQGTRLFPGLPRSMN